ncbi:MAG: hypothetical protein EOO41_02105, partial [Methanobacteriota archaeon]
MLLVVEQAGDVCLWLARNDVWAPAAEFSVHQACAHADPALQIQAALYDATSRALLVAVDSPAAGRRLLLIPLALHMVAAGSAASLPSPNQQAERVRSASSAAPTATGMPVDADATAAAAAAARASHCELVVSLEEAVCLVDAPATANMSSASPAHGSGVEDGIADFMPLPCDAVPAQPLPTLALTHCGVWYATPQGLHCWRTESAGNTEAVGAPPSESLTTKPGRGGILFKSWASLRPDTTDALPLVTAPHAASGGMRLLYSDGRMVHVSVPQPAACSSSSSSSNSVDVTESLVVSPLADVQSWQSLVFGAALSSSAQAPVRVRAVFIEQYVHIVLQAEAHAAWLVCDAVTGLLLQAMKLPRQAEHHVLSLWGDAEAAESMVSPPPYTSASPAAPPVSTNSVAPSTIGGVPAPGSAASSATSAPGTSTGLCLNGYVYRFVPPPYTDYVQLLSARFMAQAWVHNSPACVATRRAVASTLSAWLLAAPPALAAPHNSPHSAVAIARWLRDTTAAGMPALLRNDVDARARDTSVQHACAADRLMDAQAAAATLWSALRNFTPLANILAAANVAAVDGVHAQGLSVQQATSLLPVLRVALLACGVELPDEDVGANTLTSRSTSGRTLAAVAITEPVAGTPASSALNTREVAVERDRHFARVQGRRRRCASDRFSDCHRRQ